MTNKKKLIPLTALLLVVFTLATIIYAGTDPIVVDRRGFTDEEIQNQLIELMETYENWLDHLAFSLRPSSIIYTDPDLIVVDRRGFTDEEIQNQLIELMETYENWLDHLKFGLHPPNLDGRVIANRTLGFLGTGGLFDGDVPFATYIVTQEGNIICVYEPSLSYYDFRLLNWFDSIGNNISGGVRKCICYRDSFPEEWVNEFYESIIELLSQDYIW